MSLGHEEPTANADADNSDDALNALSTLSPLDGRYWEQARALSPYFSEGALIRTRVEVEARYLVALTDALSEVTDGDGRPMTRSLAANERAMLFGLASSLTNSQLARIKQIEDETQHDVKAMERGIRELVAGTSLEDVTEFIHFGLTSEDVDNLAYRLMLDRARERVMVPAANAVVDSLAALAAEHKATPMLARTHGQPAVPTTLGKEMANFAVRLQRQVRSLESVRLTGKLNGAVGNFNAHTIAAPEVDWAAFSNAFVTSLGLEPNHLTTQINPYDDITEALQALQRINGVVLDIDRDMWRYISDGWFVQQMKAGEIGSSTMPQKVNPIRFENSAGNLEFATDMLGSIGRAVATSRLQRDLENSTIVRNIGPALGHCLVAYINTLNGMQRITPNAEKLKSVLNEDYAILTEGVQTVLRQNGIADPYTIVATLAHGQNISPVEWHTWVRDLPAEIDEVTRKRLMALTPDTYIGQAVRLTEMALLEIADLRHHL